MSRDFYNTLPPGTPIAGYEIVRPIGQGGFGITYEAYNKIAKRRVAIKEFFPTGMASRDGATHVVFFGTDDKVFRWALDRFEKSTTALADLEHENILKVLNYVSAHGTGYMVMEHVNGQTFVDWLKAKEPGKPSLGELQSVLGPVCSALEYVHETKSLHRDIAPDNIMIRQNGQPVLIDFGAIKQIESDTRIKLADAEQVISSLIVSKSFYSSPEQCAGTTPLDARTDVYSLAAVLYRAVTGQPPEDAMRRRNKVFDGEGDPYVPVRDRSAAVPDSLADAIDQALALNRDKRLSNVRALRMALEAASKEGDTRPEPQKPYGSKAVKPPAKDFAERIGARAHQPVPATEPAVVYTPPPSSLPPSSQTKPSSFGKIFGFVAAAMLLVIGSITAYEFRGHLFPGKPAEIKPPRVLADGHAYCRSRFGPQSFAVWVNSDDSNPYTCDCGGGHVWNNVFTICVQPRAVRTIADGHPYCRNRFGEFAVATAVNESEANPYQCGCASGYSLNPSGAQCRETPTLERGHAFCRGRFGNADAVSVNSSADQPYTCACSGTTIWNDARTYCVSPPPPRPSLVQRIATGRWAVGGVAYCNTAGRVYTLSVSGGSVTWRDNKGNIYIESLDYNSEHEFRTTTIQSPSNRPGTRWTYVSTGSDSFQVTQDGSRTFTAARCY